MTTLAASLDDLRDRIEFFSGQSTTDEAGSGRGAIHRALEGATESGRDESRPYASDLANNPARQALEELLDLLEAGTVRAASPGAGGGWDVHPWVKRGILLGFRLGTLVESRAGVLAFCDKDTFPARAGFGGLDASIRVVPGGSAVRRGAHLGRNVTCMPPMFVNTGAYVGDGTMIDSHALVGSCAQVGSRVHISAGCQIGGVLEPVGAQPVIIEDEVLLGGNTGVYEGTRVRRRAVLGAGVVLTRSTPVYDVTRGEIRRGSGEAPLEIPEGAVVLPGTRALTQKFARLHGLALACAIIVKYRDAKTDAATALEEQLR